MMTMVFARQRTGGYAADGVLLGLCQRFFFIMVLGRVERQV